MDLSRNGAAAAPQSPEDPTSPPIVHEQPGFFAGQNGHPAPPSPIPNNNGTASFQLPAPLQQMHSTPQTSPSNPRIFGFGPSSQTLPPVAGSIPSSQCPPWRRAPAMTDLNHPDTDHSTLRDRSRAESDAGPSMNDMAEFWPPPPRERFSYTRFQLAILNAVYERIRYPNATQKWILSRRMMITKDQVKIWFQNRRRKDVVEKKSGPAGRPAGRSSSEGKDIRDGPPKHIVDQIIQELLDNQDILNGRKPVSRFPGYRHGDPAGGINQLVPPSAATSQSMESSHDSPMPPLQRPPVELDEMLQCLSPPSVNCSPSPPPRQSPDSGKPGSPAESGDSAGSPSAAALPAQPASIPTNEELDMVAPPNVSVPGSACVLETGFNTPPSSPEAQTPQPQPPQSTSPPPPNTVATDAPADDCPSPLPPARMSTGFWDAVESGEILNRYPNLMEQHLNNPHFYANPLPGPPLHPSYHPRFFADPPHSHNLSMHQHQSQIRTYPNPFFNHDVPNQFSHMGAMWPYNQTFHHSSNSPVSPTDPWRMQDSIWGRESQQSEEDDMNPSR